LRYIWIYWHLIREPLGTSALKEGAVRAVRDLSLQKRTSHKKTSERITLKKEGNGETLVGYSGRTALRREQCDVLPESRNIGFGQYRRIWHNTPLKALHGQRLIETFPKQRELKMCFHSNKSIENRLRRCSLFHRLEPTSREDREHSDGSSIQMIQELTLRAVRAFGGFQSSVESQSVQSPELNSVK
jgi:hypothetical protein